MKLLIEVEIELEHKIKNSVSAERKLTIIGNNICTTISDLVLNASLDHNEFIPQIGKQRWVDTIGNIKPINLTDLRRELEPSAEPQKLRLACAYFAVVWLCFSKATNQNKQEGKLYERSKN